MLKTNVTVEVHGGRNRGKTTILRIIQDALEAHKNLFVSQRAQTKGRGNYEYIEVVGEVNRGTE